MPTLTARKKWGEQIKSIAVGDIVIITDELNPRGQWPLARVTEVLANSDGITRVVKVRMSNK